MQTELYVAFIAASILLILMPGPNVAVIVSSSVAQGTRYGLITVAGTSSAMVFQLAVTVLGVSGLLAVFADWFEWFRWLGVVYLLYLGIRAWSADGAGASRIAASGKSPRQTFARGFLVSLTNPKTLLFYGALLPQFVDPTGDRTAQLLTLAVTFLAIAVCLDSTWAIVSGWLRPKLKLHGTTLNRITGGVLVSAAAGLALARRP
jgi:homoserine/homoserine lactone efflux protein